MGGVDMQLHILYQNKIHFIPSEKALQCPLDRRQGGLQDELGGCGEKKKKNQTLLEIKMMQ
jgi:hypothetical protein